MSVLSKVRQFLRATLVGSNSVLVELSAMEQRSEQRARDLSQNLADSHSALKVLADRISGPDYDS